MALITVCNLALARGGTPVLRNVTLTIPRGACVVVVGPSGSGKSTLLRCLNRLEEPDPGCVFLADVDITRIPVTTLRRRVGMVFQKTTALPGSVADNLLAGPRLHGVTLDRAAMAALLTHVDLPMDLLDRPANALSGGQEQRLGIARALANDPDVLLLDEPTSALDPTTARHIETTLLRLRTTRTLTLLWVSHDPDQARRVADRVVVLDNGSIRYDGDVETALVELVAAAAVPPHENTELEQHPHAGGWPT